MAVTPVRLTVARIEPASTFTMSLTRGWDKIPPERGHLAAGDLVILVVRRPLEVASGPSGWVRATSGIFYRIIGDPGSEQPPTFCAQGATEWRIEGYAVASTDFGPIRDDGSAVPWVAPPL